MPSSEPTLDELLTVGDVAALLKVSKSWVYEHTRTRGLAYGECLPHIRLGKYLRFDAHAIHAYLQRNTRDASLPSTRS